LPNASRIISVLLVLDKAFSANKPSTPSSALFNEPSSKQPSSKQPLEQNSSTVENQPEQKKQKRKSGNIDFDGRENFANFTLHKKLQWLRHLQVPETRDLTNPACTFVAHEDSQAHHEVPGESPQQ
jgi:hypothetical protein